MHQKEMKRSLQIFICNPTQKVVVIIFDDDDRELSRTIINEWVEYESDDFYTVVEPILRAEVEALKESGKLEKLCLMKPYSFVLVDEDKRNGSRTASCGRR